MAALFIHPEDAETEGINSGNIVQIFTKLARRKTYIEVTEMIYLIAERRGSRLRQP